MKTARTPCPNVSQQSGLERRHYLGVPPQVLLGALNTETAMAAVLPWNGVHSSGAHHCSPADRTLKNPQMDPAEDQLLGRRGS